MQNGAERVFQQFELEADHRRRLEDRGLAAAISETRLAQVLAGSFAFFALAVAAFALYAGAYTTAAIIGGTTLVGVVGAFLIDKSRDRN